MLCIRDIEEQLRVVLQVRLREYIDAGYMTRKELQERLGVSSDWVGRTLAPSIKEPMARGHAANLERLTNGMVTVVESIYPEEEMNALLEERYKRLVQNDPVERSRLQRGTLVNEFTKEELVDKLERKFRRKFILELAEAGLLKEEAIEELLGKEVRRKLERLRK